MAKIELNSRDLELKEIEQGEFKGKIVAQIKPAVAFDDDFVQEMKDLGVRQKISVID